ncbi:MAG: ABC transporter permease [Alicyclobacillus sp.]|nr:ABC transporter permease [Alicyclobacillus sp.]
MSVVPSTDPQLLAATKVQKPNLWRRVAGNFIVQRVARAIFIIYVVTTVTFFLVRLMPGSPIQVYVNNLVAQYGMAYDRAVQMAAALFDINLKESIVQQYLQYLVGLLHGNMGMSLLSQGTSVTSEILQYLPWTLFSVTVSLFASFIIGVLLGMYMAYRRESWLDHIVSTLSSVLHSVPNYLTAIMIIVIFGVQLKWFQVGQMRGDLSPGVVPGFNLHFVGDALYHALLPVITYVLTTAGTWALTMRSSTMRTLEEDYVLVARSRGLSDRRIAMAYVGRNSILPLIAQLTIAVGFVVGGSVLIEQIFVYQGIGWILGNAINQRDYPVMQGVFLVITFSVVVANLLADLLYSKLDPRIRIQD